MTERQKMAMEKFKSVANIVKLNLGDEFICDGRTIRLIRVTRKGFNLLWVEGHRTVLKHHLYAKGWGGKRIQNTQKEFTFMVGPYTKYLIESKKLPHST